MATEIEEALTCPYINKEKAALFGTAYFCDFDNMEFESMPAHCGQCEMYENLMKKAASIIKQEFGCRSRDDDLCCEFGYTIIDNKPCDTCPYETW